MSRPTGLDVFIYLRKSRKDLEEEKRALSEGRAYDTLERHRRELLDIAKREKHNIVNIFQEVVSGEYIIDRPEVQKMLREVEQGAVDAILVVDLERLGRGDMFDMGSIYRIIQYTETLVITPTEVINPNEEGSELLFGIKSIISREELKSITKRLQRGRKASAKEGKSITYKPPYGYLRDENLKLYPDPDTAWVIKKIFHMIADGHGRKKVAEELNQLGIKSPAGKSFWNSVTISRIIQNEVYLGHIIWGKHKNLKRNGKYKVKALPPNQWHRKDYAHEPLVSQDLFDRANKVYASKWVTPTKTTKELRNPLAGLLVCRNCGYCMTYQTDRKGSHIVKCLQSACRTIQRGVVFYRVEDKLLQSLERIVKNYEADEEIVKEMEPVPSTFPVKMKTLNTKMKKLENLETQRNNLHDLLEQKVYDISTFMERQKVITDRMKQTQGEIEQLKLELEQEKERERNRTEFIPKIKTVLDAYRESDSIEKKNRLLKSVLEKVTFYREKEWTKRDQFTIELFPRI